MGYVAYINVFFIAILTFKFQNTYSLRDNSVKLPDNSCNTICISCAHPIGAFFYLANRHNFKFAEKMFKIPTWLDLFYNISACVW